MSSFITKHCNEEVNIDPLSRRETKAEMTTPKFELFGETYMFVETCSSTVISPLPSTDQVWVKTDMGDETQIPAFGITFRKSHKICKYELRQYRVNGSFSVFKDALIVNATTGEYEVNLNRKTIIIPAFLTVLFPNASMAFYYRAMPVPKFFSTIFILLCCIAVISFFVLPWGFKSGYVFDEHKYMWLTYFSSRLGSFTCIKWIKRRSQRFDNALRSVIKSIQF
ncbi:TPA: hypothetical protein NV442_004111 [Citrobacter freundii]|uniref:hypothetical protein n=1 Tax=Citrobacter freundii TaxID=546 RepID=UPI00291DEE7B|nr:hypothetical protein RHA96_21850 [Citrobacter freundii]HCJ7750466.1 hypothetical protein [Citrobacter freundii]